MRTASENIRSDSPNLADIRRLIPKHGDVAVHTILVHALTELKDLVNVGKNLTNAQIAYIASRIMSSYWMLKPEEVKFVLYRAVEREKLFDRLDPNIVLGWFADYDAERTEEAIRLSEEEESKKLNSQPSEGAMSFREYLDKLEELAAGGDSEAITKLKEIKNPPVRRMTFLSEDARRQHEQDFKKRRLQYILNKNRNEKEREETGGKI